MWRTGVQRSAPPAKAASTASAAASLLRMLRISCWGVPLRSRPAAAAGLSGARVGRWPGGPALLAPVASGPSLQAAARPETRPSSAATRACSAGCCSGCAFFGRQAASRMGAGGCCGCLSSSSSQRGGGPLPRRGTAARRRPGAAAAAALAPQPKPSPPSASSTAACAEAARASGLPPPPAAGGRPFSRSYRGAGSAPPAAPPRWELSLQVWATSRTSCCLRSVNRNWAAERPGRSPSVAPVRQHVGRHAEDDSRR